MTRDARVKRRGGNVGTSVDVVDEPAVGIGGFGVTVTVTKVVPTTRETLSAAVGVEGEEAEEIGSASVEEEERELRGEVDSVLDDREAEIELADDELARILLMLLLLLLEADDVRLTITLLLKNLGDV